MSSLLSDLADVGYPVRHVCDLVQSKVRYREAIPVLLRWLPLLEDRRELEWTVRALGVSWAKSEVRQPLLDFFEELVVGDSVHDGLRWVVGDSLYTVYDDSIFEDCVRLAQDERYGTGRKMVVLGLKKSKRPEAVGVLIGLVDDPDVGGHAVDALAWLKAPEARETLLSKVDHEQAWVRRAAKRGLAKLPEVTTGEKGDTKNE